MGGILVPVNLHIGVSFSTSNFLGSLLRWPSCTHDRRVCGNSRDVTVGSCRPMLSCDEGNNVAADKMAQSVKGQDILNACVQY